MTRYGSHTESRMRENCTYGSMRGRAYPTTRGAPLYSTPSSFLSLKFSAVDTWERRVETGKTREISFLVDYANLRYANPRKHHIALCDWAIACDR